MGGTTSIKNSEKLCTLLEEFSLTPKLLNARPENVKKEAQIISNAGTLGSITISTNMAGRGTDIVLGGDLTVTLKLHLLDILKSLDHFLTSMNLNHRKMNLSEFKSVLD